MKKTSRRGTRLLIIIASIIALLGLGAYFLYFDPIFASDQTTEGVKSDTEQIAKLRAEREKLQQNMESVMAEYYGIYSSFENLDHTKLAKLGTMVAAEEKTWEEYISKNYGDLPQPTWDELKKLNAELRDLKAEEIRVGGELETLIEERARKDLIIKAADNLSDEIESAQQKFQTGIRFLAEGLTENQKNELTELIDKNTSSDGQLPLQSIVKYRSELATANDDPYKFLENQLVGKSPDQARKAIDALASLDLENGTVPDNVINLAKNLQNLGVSFNKYIESAKARQEDEGITASFVGPKGAVIDQLTGRVQFRSPILVDVKDSSGKLVKNADGTVQKNEIGYALFDPVKKTYSGVLTVDDFNGQQVSLVADQLTKDVYLEYGGGLGDEKIVGDDKLGLVSVRVGENGGIGGSFTVSNRLFIYNPNTKAFQIPISLDSTIKGAGFSGDDVGSVGKNTIYLGTDGSVTGKVGDVGRFKDGSVMGSGALYLAHDGTVTYGMSFTDGGLPLGGISINSDGDIAGTVNLAKMVDLPLNISFGSGGITGVSFDVGGGATKIPISIGKNGQLAFSLATFNIGSLIPGLNLPGILSNLLNVPILNVAQDAHGNFRLYFLFGSMKLFGHENRPLTPPEIEMDEEGNYKTECIYFRHSFKKALMTVRVYQSPCTKIEADEQKLRSAMIFEVYNRLLGRNPSTQEWANWYFYSGHQLYQWPKHEKDKQYRMDGTKLQLEKAIMGTAYYKGINSANKLDNLKEYRWIKAGKNPLQAPTRPTDLMTADPFAGKTDGGNGVDEVDKERIAKWISEGFDKFFKGIEADAATDEEMEEPTEDEISVNVPTGFSFFAVPSSIAYIDPKSFTDKGVSVYRYDGDDKKWITDANGGDVGTMRSVFGYYLYNSGAEKTVIAYKPENVENQSLSTITKGWNLLANSSQGSITVGSVKFLNPTDSTKVSLISLAQQKKIYSGTYLISDPNAQTAEKAFTKIDLLSSGAQNNLIQSLGGYWVYLF
ncbi:MAG: hypothetical protein BWY43_00546 [candidate division WS2 bacterium ADurb.Bin280]|uniref:Uncharacterized protein n=1 Tax=candidate division WS2 bacterium ADurb.Bin280 TaxID=1852829 RepID=A0A1V5SCV1_9BACT|nr:MAG: hypothetical protein BWY43_00546 [candidate division WS2 bacterium ADurb.Bin280]